MVVLGVGLGLCASGPATASGRTPVVDCRVGRAHGSSIHESGQLMARFGNVEVRPVGGAVGCLAMIAFSVLASVILTVLLNLIL